jgi:hypothetical protein
VFRKLRIKYKRWIYLQELKRLSDTYEFVWGIESLDIPSPYYDCIPELYDICIRFNKKLKKYILNIGTNIKYDNKSGEKKYIKFLFDKLTEWMFLQGYNTDKELHMYDVFTKGYNAHTEFDSIEDLYSTFKILVNGFAS